MRSATAAMEGLGPALQGDHACVQELSRRARSYRPQGTTGAISQRCLRVWLLCALGDLGTCLHEAGARTGLGTFAESQLPLRAGNVLAQAAVSVLTEGLRLAGVG